MGQKAVHHIIVSPDVDATRRSVLIYLQLIYLASQSHRQRRDSRILAQPVIVSELLHRPSPLPLVRPYRRYLEGVLLAMLRECLLSTPRVDRYLDDRRFGFGPVAPSHLVRGGPSPGRAGLAKLSGSSLPGPSGPGPAILPAQPLERLGRTRCFRARPAALVPFRRRLSRALAPTNPGSRATTSCERV